LGKNLSSEDYEQKMYDNNFVIKFLSLDESINKIKVLIHLKDLYNQERIRKEENSETVSNRS
jgi:hypothetical protein